MPVFDFYCRDCERTFEKNIPRGSENPCCPDCSSQTEKQVPRLRISGGISGGKTDSSCSSCSSAACSSCH